MVNMYVNYVEIYLMFGGFWLREIFVLIYYINFFLGLNGNKFLYEVIRVIFF